MVALVIGFSISGRACSELLLSQGKQVLAVDRRAEALSTDSEKRVSLIDENSAIDWSTVELLVLSPGVSRDHPHVKEAKRQGIEVIGEIELAFRSLKNPCIGITGTNGKTTTTLLTSHILNSTGRKARALGNIGAALSTYALSPDPEEILVIELSSFQLETLQSKCLDCAICLNITPDHLHRYASMLDYAKTKCHIEDCLKEGAALYVSKQLFEDYGSLLQRPIIFEPAQPVYPLCRHFGVSEEAFFQALKTFKKPPHRIEYVGEWKGLTFYNDSKATNIDAVIHAVALMDGPVVLLAGGLDKGASYRPWIASFGSKVERIVAFGRAADKMEAELKESFSFEKVQGMQEPLTSAVRCAMSPMNILLSPGCSSFDQFRNYEERGNEFKRMVEEKVWIEKNRS
jgi:UDP-N-acetylmuramoylalanine--D-glutamate ligase